MRKRGSASMLVLLASTAAGHTSCFLYPLVLRPPYDIRTSASPVKRSAVTMMRKCCCTASSHSLSSAATRAPLKMCNTKRDLAWNSRAHSQLRMTLRSLSSGSRDPNEELVDIVENALSTDCKIRPGDTLLLAVR
jgi:hypothetical protein